MVENFNEEWIQCDACHYSQFKPTDGKCANCNQPIAKLAYQKSLPSDDSKITKEISCLKCRTLWIGVGIATVALMIILNLTYNMFDFQLYETLDILRYTFSLATIGILGFLTYRALDNYCHDKGGEKGSLSTLTFGLAIAIITIFLLVLTASHLENTVFFYSNIETDQSEVVDKLLSGDCKLTHNLVIKDRYTGAMKLSYIDFEKTLDKYESSLGAKWEKCNGRYFNDWEWIVN